MHFLILGWLLFTQHKTASVAGRRLTVPLTGDGDATMSKLMKDDAEYTYAELPRINPHYKVIRQSHYSQPLVSKLMLIGCQGH